MECFRDVPSVIGRRPVWLAFLRSAAEWRHLTEDSDWDRLIERERRPFGLLTVSLDPQAELEAWSEFTDYCVERELRLTASWGENTTLLDDLFDESAVARMVYELPGSMPLTSWHDDEPLEETLEYFLNSDGSDLRRDDDVHVTDWVRVAIVANDEAWRHELRAALSAASRP